MRRVLKWDLYPILWHLHSKVLCVGPVCRDQGSTHSSKFSSTQTTCMRTSSQKSYQQSEGVVHDVFQTFSQRICQPISGKGLSRSNPCPGPSASPSHLLEPKRVSFHLSISKVVSCHMSICCLTLELNYSRPSRVASTVSVGCITPCGKTPLSGIQPLN